MTTGKPKRWKKMTKAEAGALGGTMTHCIYGSNHMAAIGARGARTLHDNYDMEPIGQNNFAYRHKETREVVAVQFGNKAFQERRRTQQ